MASHQRDQILAKLKMVLERTQDRENSVLSGPVTQWPWASALTLARRQSESFLGHIELHDVVFRIVI